MTHDDETVERMAVWPLIHTLLVQFAPRIAEAEAATTYDERIAIINGVSAHIAKKVEDQIDAEAALSALPRADGLEGIGPRPHVLVCKGCPAYETEAWREPSGDGETYDNGQYAWCKAAGRRSMGAYHYDHNAAPDWCPARARLAAQAGER